MRKASHTPCALTRDGAHSKNACEHASKNAKQVKGATHHHMSNDVEKLRDSVHVKAVVNNI